MNTQANIPRKQRNLTSFGGTTKERVKVAQPVDLGKCGVSVNATVEDSASAIAKACKAAIKAGATGVRGTLYFSRPATADEAAKQVETPVTAPEVPATAPEVPATAPVI